MKLLSLIFISILSSQITLGSSADTVLPQALVTGSRINYQGQSSIQSGNIVILTHEQISQIPAFSIDQILRFAGGVEVQSRNSFGAQSDFSIRGSTFTQVLVLIDGVRIFDPLTAHSNCYIPVGIEEIEQIEIIRGGASYIYGPDAMGGVINIITKTGSGKSLKVEPQQSAAVGIGSYDMNYFRGGLVEQHKNWVFSVAANTVNAHGNTMASGNKNYFDLGTVSGSVRYNLKNQQAIYFRSGYDNRRYNAQNYYTLSPADSARASQETFFNQASYFKVKNSGSQRRIDASWQRAYGTFRFNKLVRPNQHTTDFFFLQGNENYELSKNLKLNVGFQGDYKGINSNDRGVHSRIHAGAYSTIQYNLEREKIVTEIGLRHDYDERGGHFTSPNIGIYKLIHNGSVGLRAGRAYRVADFTELYVSHGLPAVGNLRNFGNPNLGIEKSMNFELSASQRFKTLDIRGAMFNRRVIGIIDYVMTPGAEITHTGNLQDTFNYFFPKNISDVNFTGAELGITDTRKIDKITLMSSLMYVRVNSVFPGSFISKYVSTHAVNMAQFSVTLNYDKIVEFTIAGFYKDRKPDESTNPIKPDSEIFVMNLGANVWFLNHRVAAQIRVENVADRKYYDVLGAEMAPRWFNFGILIR